MSHFIANIINLNAGTAASRRGRGLGLVLGLALALLLLVSAAYTAEAYTVTTGSLQITKSVNWNGTPVVAGQTFQICVKGPAPATTETCKNFNDTYGWVQTWTNLVPGSYTVTEKTATPVALGNWEITGNNATATVTSGSTATKTITNKRSVGSFQASKRVVWNGVPQAPTQKFTICLVGPSYPNGNETGACKEFGATGGTLVWTNLIPGNYTATETGTTPGSLSDWTVTGSPVNGTVEANCPLQPPPDGLGATCLPCPSPIITNTLKVGSLTVTKTVNWNGVTPDQQKTFQICITGPSFPTTPDCKTADFDGGPLSWSSLIPGNYTVTETDPGAEWSVNVTGSPATVTTGGTANAAVTNTRNLGSLQVTKSVNWNGTPVVAGQTFQICVKGPAPATTETCKNFNDTYGWVQTWTNLVPGNYTVTEKTATPVALGNWEITGNNATATVTSGSTATKTITNKRSVGSFQASKRVVWNGVPQAPTQKFTICLVGPSYPNGNETGACKEFGATGGTLVWTNLIPGNYTATETGTTPGSLSDWTVTGSPVNGTVEANCPLQPPPDGLGATCLPCPSPIITNTLKVGSLTVTKTVNWNGVTPDQQKTFQICITGPSFPTTPDCKIADFDGGPLSWSSLIPGAYIVTETDPGAEWSVNVTGSPATVTTGGTANAAVTNTRNLGSLQVTKTVNWNGVTPDTQRTFQICITGPSFPTTPDCKTADFDGGPLSWSSLIPGNYTVTETDPGAEWSVNVTGSPASVPTNGGQATAGVTNDRKLGSLKVTKTVNWNGVPEDANQSFEICIAGPSYPAGDCQSVGYVGGTLPWNDLIPGDYTVTETNPGAQWLVTVPASPIAVLANGAATADVDNTHKLGSLKITKTVNWNDATINLPQTFEICISGPSYPDGDEPGACQTTDFDGGTLAWTNLIPGDYLVTETDPGPAWTVLGSGVEVTVASDCQQPDQCPATHEITNAYKRGGLTVTKSVNWNGAEQEPVQNFQICLTGPSFPTGTELDACQDFGYQGETRSWFNLIPGNYTVTEAPPGVEWTVTGSGVSANVPAGCEGISPTTVDPNQLATCPSVTITNARRVGSLQVTKIVNWNGVPADRDQDFEICITGPSYPPPNANCQELTNAPNGGVITWTNLIPGPYVVTEKTPAPAGGWAMQIAPAQVTVPDDGGLATATVTNSRKAPKLELDKAVVGDGNAVGNVITFTIRITNTGPTALKMIPLTDVFTGPVELLRSEPAQDAVTGNQITWNNLVAKFGAVPLEPGDSFLVTVVFGVDTGEDEAFNMDNTAVVNGAWDTFDTPANRADDTVQLSGFTYVDLLYFIADPAPGGVQLSWATQTEFNNYGFYLLRSATGLLMDAVRLPAFVPGTGHGQHSGASYAIIDGDVQPGQAYTYWLVDVDLDGTETIHPECAFVTTAAGSQRIYLPVVAN